MVKKRVTIENLAVMIKRGFDQTVTKEEFQRGMESVVTKTEFRKEIGALKEQITRLSADISRLKEEVHRDDPFVEDLLRRMRVVEKRVGVVK